MSESLPSELQHFVQQQVATGRYASADDVMCDALRLLQSRDTEQQVLRQEIQVGLDQIARGDVETHDMESLKAEVRRRLASKEEPR